jgi:Flp pilus assembly pilin Flp
MDTLSKLISALHEDESGITNLEFILITILIAVASLATIELLGGEIVELYESVHQEMSSGQIRGGLSQ